MKRVLFDAHVVLDVLLDRQPFVGESAAAWAAVETGRAEGILAAHSVTTIYDLLQKPSGSASAKRVFSAILKAFGVASVDAPVMLAALRLPFSDFEDAVTAAAAQSAGCEYVVTRDPKGFRHSPFPPLTPEAALRLSAR